MFNQQPQRVAGLIIEDVAPRDSPSAGSPPHFLQTMLKISLQLRKAVDDIGMSTARRIAIETLRESVEVCTEAKYHIHRGLGDVSGKSKKKRYFFYISFAEGKKKCYDICCYCFSRHSFNFFRVKS